MNIVFDEKGNLFVEMLFLNVGDYVRFWVEMDLIVVFFFCLIEKGKCNGDSVMLIWVEVS